VLVVSAILAGLLGACSGSRSSPNGTITLYSGQHQLTTQALIQGFEKQTGIKVNVRYDDEDTLVDQIITEGSRTPADVIFTENSPALEDLETHNRLVPLAATTLSQTPSKYNSPQSDWVAVSARVSVLVYNPKLISADQLPTSVLQLADPRYKGKLAFAPSETDFQPIVTAVAKSAGTSATVSWLKGLASNGSGHVYPDNETVTSQVNRGVVAFGVINQYYWYRMAAEIGSSAVHSKIAYFAAGDPGYVVDVSGAGVLASSKHQADAARFVAYLVSPDAQKVIADSLSFEYPLADGVSPSAPETPFADLRPYPISIADLGTGSNAVTLLQQAGLL
jgi:iron(III) transport system substrate-binding protein